MGTTSFKVSSNIAGFIFLFCFSFYILLSSVAYAAVLDVRASETPREGSPILITLSLDTEGENINALEASLSYPRDILTLREIRDGNSLINFWLERPLDTNGSIRFAGITPGGYVGKSAEVFVLLFDVKNADDVYFNLSAAQAMLNDGEGTSVPLRLSSAVVVENQKTDTSLALTDTTSPEPFVITRGSDESLFDGKEFIVFATQDKQSGIDHYEVAQSIFYLFWPFTKLLSFDVATSPHPIALKGYIHVKAIDRAGNDRMTVLSPEDGHFYDDLLVLLGILFLLVVIVYGYARRSLLSQ